MEKQQIYPNQLVEWQGVNYNVLFIGESHAGIGFWHPVGAGERIQITGVVPFSQLSPVKEVVQ